MSEDWSRKEVELTVASYLEMLSQELRSQNYSKADSWRELMKQFPRSKGAIEFKYGNISAVLLDLGMPYVRGYKPYRNYQQLLFEVVAEMVGADHTLQESAREDATRAAVVPSVEDILSAMVAPPAREAIERTGEPNSDKYTARGRQPRPPVNYLELEARNSSLGLAGEQFAVRYEQARLIREGAERLASKVEQVSITQGDGLGYDILSFEANGAERFIEVKTTKYGPATPFFLTTNEVDASKDHPTTYSLYRLFDFRQTPKLFALPGELSISCDLRPHIFKARVA